MRWRDSLTYRRTDTAFYSLIYDSSFSRPQGAASAVLPGCVTGDVSPGGGGGLQASDARQAPDCDCSLPRSSVYLDCSKKRC